MKKKVAILLMVDGAVVGEQYLEYSNQREDQEWANSEDSPIDPALHFFY